ENGVMIDISNNRIFQSSKTESVLNMNRVNNNSIHLTPLTNDQHCKFVTSSSDMREVNKLPHNKTPRVKHESHARKMQENFFGLFAKVNLPNNSQQNTQANNEEPNEDIKKIIDNAKQQDTV
ncbi:MAG: hypothetical protein ACREGC_03160, partial [Minisyncoccia bacterium]